MTESAWVLAFDMDGTLFDTEAVKMACFRDAFAPLCTNDDELREVEVYNAAHRGIPRADKFRHVLSAILGQPQRRQDEVAERYARLLEDGLSRCRPIPGLKQFLADVAATRYVVSSAPEAEIARLLAGHGLDDAFRGVYGSRWTKAQALAEIRLRHADARVLYFGDAPADREAAKLAEVGFVAMNPNAALKAQVGVFVDDFTRLDAAALAGLPA